MTATPSRSYPLERLARQRQLLSAGCLFAASWARRNALATIVVAFSTIVFATRSVWAHLQYQSNSFDLGIFGQGVKGYALGRGPISEIKGFSLLGDHFSPISAVLAPFYLVFPSIVVLLVAQAVLIALGAAPLVNWTQRTLGRWPAVAIGFIFASSFGVASAIGFDFHEVAFAVPLLSFSLCALGRGKFVAAAVWALPLVLVKEDLGATVAAIGLLIALRGGRLLGAAVMLFGLGASALEVLVLIPLANPGGSYAYAAQSGGFHPLVLLNQWTDPSSLSTKVTTLVLTLSIGVFLSTRSSLLLVAAPTMIWRFTAPGSAYWGTIFQYSLVIMPIVVAAVVEVLVRHHSRGRDDRAFLRWALLASVAVAVVTSLAFPVGQMLRPAFWQKDPRIGSMQAAVDLIPAGASVAATNHLVPHLTDKASVSVLIESTATGPRPEWIAADMTEAWPDSAEQRTAYIGKALQSGYHRIYWADGVMVLKKDSGAN